MTFRQKTFILLGVILILSAFQFERTEGVRLCGRRLADLLNFICEKHGGFHAPRARRDVPSKSASKREVIEVLWPVSRRTDSDATNTNTADSVSEDEEAFSYQSGIVDECCKKQCSLATLISYCANVQQAGTIDFDDMLPSGAENFPPISDEELAAYQLQQTSSAAGPESSSGGTHGHPMSISSHIAYSSRPNLGLSARNRPVFIVLSQLQEDEDRELGEYRF